MSTQDGFLEQPLTGLENMTVKEMKAYMNSLTEKVTVEQILQQKKINQEEILKTQQIVKQAQRDNLLPEDSAEAENDNSLLLKNTSGTHNPVLAELLKKKARGQLSSEESALLDQVTTFQTEVGNSVAPEKSFSDRCIGLTLPCSLHFKTLKGITIPLVSDLPNGEVLPAYAVVKKIIVKGTLLPESAFVIGTIRTGNIPDDPDNNPQRWATTENPITGAEMGPNGLEIDCKKDSIYHDCQLAITLVNGDILQSSLQILIEYEQADENDIVSLPKSEFVKETCNINLQPQIPKDLQEAIPVGPTRKQMAADPNNPVFDPLPVKERVNRYAVSENGESLAPPLPDHVAAYAADGTPIPVINDGKHFNPTIPDVFGNRDHRNKLMASQYEPEKDRPMFFNPKMQWAVISCIGPKGCKIKTDRNLVRIWGFAKSKAACKEICDWVRFSAYFGKLWNLEVVDMRSWFAIPPIYAEGATSTYSNPLHREYMESYLREQKRATIELEQRVLDETAMSKSRGNTIAKQLRRQEEERKSGAVTNSASTTTASPNDPRHNQVIQRL